MKRRQRIARAAIVALVVVAVVIACARGARL